jgi:hypothetical protein
MFLACGSWCGHVSAQPLSGAGTGRYLLVRTLLVFARSIKPDEDAQAVETGRKFVTRRRFRAKYGWAATVKKFSSPTSSTGSIPFAHFKNMKLDLVVVMIVVEMWKAQKQRSGTASNARHAPVANGENSGKVPAMWRSQCGGAQAGSPLQHEIRRIHNGSPQLLFRVQRIRAGSGGSAVQLENSEMRGTQSPRERQEHPTQTHPR